MVDKILISIKPEYANKILIGSKKYEYRKVHLKANINKMVLYVTFPIMKIVGEMEIVDILENDPQSIWETTKNHSGSSKALYDKYYKNKDLAIAYKIGRVTRYNNPKELSEIGINFSPQSFVYLDK